jgi:Flp pilus assembly protein TadD
MAIEFDQRTNPNWFLDQLTFYQAANSSPEAIKRNFRIRIAEFEQIVEALHNKQYDDPVQHELILGRRGSGKSTLLRRIQVEIDENPGLSAKYIAINLAEEQASIYRLSDLWFEVLEELMARLGQRKQLEKFSDFPDNQAYTRYLDLQIHQLLLAANKKAVLLLDNLDRILENFSDDANLLRETLLNHNDLAIIGGSTRMDEHFWDYRRPFYEFFRRHRLQGLTFGEIHDLLNHWATEMNLPVLHDYALRNRGKVEAIRILTDGLPRALQFFIQILLHDSARYGFDYLRNVMDRATPLYQERLNNLTAPQRKIVQEMAFHWEAIPTKLLTEKCRMESKLISSYLKQLDGFGIIETLPTGNKNHLYRITERFFNMWLIVTQGNPDQKRRAKYLTFFLESFYDGHELVELAKGHIEKLKAREIGFDKAMVLSKGLVHSRFIGVNERDELIALTQGLYGYKSSGNELPETAKSILEKVDELIKNKNFNKALTKINEIENEADGLKQHYKGRCYYHLSEFNKAENYFMQALKNGYIEANKSLEQLYEEQGRLEDAEQHFYQAANNNYEYLNSLAIFYSNSGKSELAEMYYLRAIQKGSVVAMFNLGSLYFDSNRKPELAWALIKEAYGITGIAGMETYLPLMKIWNGRTENIKEYLRKLIEKNIGGDIYLEMQQLLFLSQTHLVLSFFHDPELGKDLIAKYELLYYATLILANETGDNLLLKIPPEVMPTVEHIVAEVKEKQAFYAQPPGE